MPRYVIIETTIRVRAVFRAEDMPRRVSLRPPLPPRDARLAATCREGH